MSVGTGDCLSTATIHRTLRPIRSRLQALSKDLELPSIASASYQQCTNYNNNQNNIKRTYKRKNTAKQVICKEAKPRSPTVFKNHADFVHKYPTLPSPIRRHAVYFKSTIKDAFRKFWADLKRKRIENHVLSLSQLTAYCIGDHIENLEDMDEQVEFYDCLPDHLRRFVFLQHLIRIVIESGSTLEIILEIIDVCKQFGACLQVACLVEYACAKPGWLSCEIVSTFYTAMMECNQLEKYQKILINNCCSISNGDNGIELYKFCSNYSDFFPDFLLPVVTELCITCVASNDLTLLKQRLALVIHLILMNYDKISGNQILDRMIDACYHKDSNTNDILTCLHLVKFYIDPEYLILESDLCHLYTESHVAYVYFCFRHLDKILTLGRLILAQRQFEDSAWILEIAHSLLQFGVSRYETLTSSNSKDNPSFQECRDLYVEICRCIDKPRNMLASDFGDVQLIDNNFQNQYHMDIIDIPLKSVASGTGEIDSCLFQSESERGILSEAVVDSDDDPQDIFGDVSSDDSLPDIAARRRKRKRLVLETLENNNMKTSGNAEQLRRYQFLFSSPKSGNGLF